MAIAPTGTPLGEPLCRDEGILHAEIDVAQSIEPKRFHNMVGSYNRFDIVASRSIVRGPSGHVYSSAVRKIASKIRIGL